MTDPNDTDDGWADLARELGVDETQPAKPAARPAVKVFQPEPEPEPEYEPEPVTAEYEAGDEETGDDESEDSDGDEAAGEAGEPGSAEGEGDPGQKKRRRRRRRRKKKGAAPVNGDAAPAVADAGTDDAEEEFAEEPEAVAEESAVEPGRDVIANWNVPSWQEIVAGLYRPQGH